MKRHNLGFLILILAIVGVMAMGASRNAGQSEEPEYPSGENPSEHAGYQAVIPYEPVTPPPAAETSDQPRLIPESLSISLQPGEEHVEHKTMHLPESPRPEKVDILWCFDLTASMYGEIDSVKANSFRIMNEIRSQILDSRFGVISHMDYPRTYSYCQYTATYGISIDYPYRLDPVSYTHLTLPTKA